MTKKPSLQVELPCAFPLHYGRLLMQFEIFGPFLPLLSNKGPHWQLGHIIVFAAELAFLVSPCFHFQRKARFSSGMYCLKC